MERNCKAVLSALVVALVLTPLLGVSTLAQASTSLTQSAAAQLTACSKAVSGTSKLTKAEFASCNALISAVSVPCRSGSQGIVFNLKGVDWAVRVGSRPLRLGKSYKEKELSALCLSPAAPAAPNKPGIGSTITVLNQNKQNEAVTLQAVTDPAQGADQFTTPEAGKRFVGVTFQIKNDSAGIDKSDADSNTDIVGSDSQVYTPKFGGLVGCTDFDAGEFTLAQGEAEVGCITFELPTGVTAAKVQYNPNSGFSTNDAEWTLTPPG
jgi:Domain of unknown function (DUF4352)